MFNKMRNENWELPQLVKLCSREEIYEGERYGNLSFHNTNIGTKIQIIRIAAGFRLLRTWSDRREAAPDQPYTSSLRYGKVGG